jgi:hypothetical protein
MKNYLVVVGLIFAIMAGGIVVDRLYARFARRNPQLGPFRKNDGGCGCCAAKEACNVDSASCHG